MSKNYAYNLTNLRSISKTPLHFSYIRKLLNQISQIYVKSGESWQNYLHQFKWNGTQTKRNETHGKNDSSGILRRKIIISTFSLSIQLTFGLNQKHNLLLSKIKNINYCYDTLKYS